MTKTNKLFAAVSLSIVSAWCFWQGSSPSAELSIDSNIRSVSNNEPAGPRAGLPIEQIRVGMRVAALNPVLSEMDRAGFIEPDQATWRLIKLEMTKADGGLLEIDLIRPEEWIRVPGVFRGGLVYLDMPELGAKGLARVLHIGPCPKIDSSEGQVVISTLAHPATHKILDVTFGDAPPEPDSFSSLQPVASGTPIGVTATHPFWSVSRQAFVPIGEMAVGEQVVTLHGETKQIASILPRPGAPERVYNLEVNSEHTYFVGNDRLLVHNNGCLPDDILRLAKKRQFVVVIGRSMDRVNGAAEILRSAGLNVKTWNPSNFGGLSNPLEANRSWLRHWVIEKNATVIDIGQGSIRTSSDFYNMELRSVYKNWIGVSVLKWIPGF